MANPPYPIIPPQMKRSWLENHPRWKIPLGFLVLILLFGGFGAGLMTVLVASFRSSDVYKQSFVRAGANPQVRQSLGEPIQPGWFITGQLNVNGSTGNANLSIPISGPRGKAAIRVIASKTGGIWTFTYLQVKVEGRQECIDLMSTPPS